MMLGKMIKETLDHLFKRAATSSYPLNKESMINDTRGKLKFFAEKCVGCKLCMKDCPSNAITINKLPDNTYEAVLDMGKCIYCGQCVDSCAKKALEITNEFELAAGNSKDLKVKINVEPPKQS